MFEIPKTIRVLKSRSMYRTVPTTAVRSRKCAYFMFALARQLSRDVSEDVGILNDKAEVLERTKRVHTL